MRRHKIIFCLKWNLSQNTLRESTSLWLYSLVFCVSGHWAQVSITKTRLFIGSIGLYSQGEVLSGSMYCQQPIGMTSIKTSMIEGVRIKCERNAQGWQSILINWGMERANRHNLLEIILWMFKKWWCTPRNISFRDCIWEGMPDPQESCPPHPWTKPMFCDQVSLWLAR
jgi:hypothetical protein